MSIASNGTYFVVHTPSENYLGSSTYEKVSNILVLYSSLSTFREYSLTWSGNSRSAISKIMLINDNWILFHNGIIKRSDSDAPSSASFWDTYTTQIAPGQVITNGVYVGNKYLFSYYRNMVYRSSSSSINSTYQLVLETDATDTGKMGIAESNGYVVAIDTEENVAASKSPFSSWDQFSFPSQISNGVMTSNGDTVIYVGQSDASGVIHGYRAYGRVLPTISPDKSRAFIKARSGK